MNFTEDSSSRYARYHCSTCSRPFDRKDTLARHMQVHNRRDNAEKTRRKACISCCRSKTRCSGERPKCASCARRGIDCVYEGRPRNQQQAERNQFSPPTRQPDEARSLSCEGDCAKNVSILNSNSPMPPSQSPGSSLAQVCIPAVSGSCYVANEAVTLDATPGLQPQAPLENLLYTTFDDMDFNSNLDWMLDESDTGNKLFSPSDIFGYSASSDTQRFQSFLISAPQTAVSSPRHFDVVDSHMNTPDQALGGLLTPQPQETCYTGDPWPVETPRPPQRQVSLPALGPQGLANRAITRFSSITPVDTRTWHGLQKCLMLPFEHNRFQSLDIAQFPAKEMLDDCIDLFFAHFHPMLDVVHQPTFDPSKDLVVTLSIISVGACYSDFSGAKLFSVALSELVRKLLVFMAESDRRFVRTRSYVTAQLLQGTHGYCSGSERLFELSESCRGTITHHAKCMGLFRADNPENPKPGETLDETWRAWVDAEGLRRLGWAVYKYDASVAYLHNNRPFLSTGDVNLPLPASVEHWGAESGQAWAALHPWSQVCPSSPRLRPTIRSFFDNTQRPLENIVVEEHIFLITLTLVRMLWTLKEIRSSPINDLVSPPVYDNGRQTLLQALDGMMVSVVPFSKLHTKAEIDRVVHRMQLIHVAHLYGAGDLMNWLWPSLRDGPEAENARERMRQWSNEDLQRSRNVVYHCAQLLGLIRHYPNNMPFEVFLIFHAGVVLSCIVPLLEAEMFRERTTVLHLDQLDPGDELLFKRHDDWVKNGGNTQLCLTGVPSLCSAGARRAILDQTALLLRRQKVWGMARNLTKVVLSLGARSAEMQAREEQLI